MTSFVIEINCLGSSEKLEHDLRLLQLLQVGFVIVPGAADVGTQAHEDLRDVHDGRGLLRPQANDGLHEPPEG